MRILFIADKFYPLVGGGENYVLNLATRMVDKGHKVLVFTSRVPNTPQREVKEGLEIVRFPPILRVHGQPLTPFAQEVLRSNVDVIHVSGPTVNEDLLLPALHLLDKPTVVTYHADFILRHPLLQVYYRLKARIPYGFADRVIVTSGKYAQILQRRGLPRGKVRVIPLGVDEAVFRPAVQGETARLRKRYDLSGDILLFVGGLSRRHEYKHPELLLTALTGLLERRRLTLVMVGGGERVRHFQAWSAKLGLDGHVRFTGQLPSQVVADLYRIASVFVLPSPTSSEGFGTVLLEAMASGCPVVCTGACGGAEMVDRAKAGIVVEPWSPEALATAIERILSSKEEAQALARNGRSAIETHYQLDRVTERTLKVYAEVRGCA